MTDVRTYPDKHLTYWWVPEGGIADTSAPTAAEINAGVNISQAIAWDTTDVNPSDSSDVDDAAITDSATAVQPGYDQYDATLNLFYPKDMSLDSDPFVVAYNVFSAGRTTGYVVRRFSPDDVNTSTAMDTAATGDWVQLFYMESDYASQNTAGETSVKYEVKLLPQGFMSQPVLVKSSNPVVIEETLAAVVGDVNRITAALDGFDVTVDCTWTSSDNTKATVSANGVVTAVAAGTATITAAYPSASASATCTVTVSAS